MVGFSKVGAVGLVFLVAGVAVSVLGHDMWLESSRFFSEPGQELRIRLGNGTIFEVSENAVDPERLTRFSVQGPEGVAEKAGPQRIEGNWLSAPIHLKGAGNYWIAAATKPRSISLSGADFNDYLEHDGVLNVLEERKKEGILERDEVEFYSKYVKAYLQVGDTQTDNFRDPAGLEIELIPQNHPYKIRPGQELTVEARFRNRPLAGLWLHAAAEGSSPDSQKTDSNGLATFSIDASGRWYIRGIHLFEVDAPDHSYESYWASLTFAVR